MKIRRWVGNGEAGFNHWCPGCGAPHGIRTVAKPGQPIWTWDGSETSPTTSPSVRCFTSTGEKGAPFR